MKLPYEFNSFKTKINEFLLFYKDDDVIYNYLKCINRYINSNVLSLKGVLLKVDTEFINHSNKLINMNIDTDLKSKRLRCLYNVFKDLNLILNKLNLTCAWCNKEYSFVYFEDNLTCSNCYEKY